MNLTSLQLWWSRPGVCRALRIFLGLLLIWAAVSKIGNPTKFLGDVIAYRMPLPRGLLSFAAAVLPWVELISGILLLVGAWLEASLGLTTALFLVFILATGQAWARGLKIACGCFDLKLLGLSSESSLVHILESPGFALIRNIVLGSVAFWLLVREVSIPGSVSVPTTATPDKTLDLPSQRGNKKGGSRRRQ